MNSNANANSDNSQRDKEVRGNLELMEPNRLGKIVCTKNQKALVWKVILVVFLLGLVAMLVVVIVTKKEQGTVLGELAEQEQKLTKQQLELLKQQQGIQYLETRINQFSRNKVREPLYGCPAGYEASFNRNCYKFVITPTDWHDAGRRCRIDGAALVSIETRDEQNHLATYLHSHANLYDGIGSGYWTSGNDIKKEGHWIWNTSSQEMTYRNIKTPFDNHAGIEHCMEMNRQEGWAWNDVACNSTLSYICEHPKTVT